MEKMEIYSTLTDNIYEEIFRIFELEGRGFLSREDLAIGLNKFDLYPKDIDIFLLLKRYDLKKPCIFLAYIYTFKYFKSIKNMQIGKIQKISRKNKINKTMIINNKTGNNEKENILEDKNGKKIDITGYKLYQFLVGSLLDYFLIIKKNLKTGGLDNDFIELFMLILELIKYVINEAKNNINKYKNAYFNRKRK